MEVFCTARYKSRSELFETVCGQLVNTQYHCVSSIVTPQYFLYLTGYHIK